MKQLVISAVFALCALCGAQAQEDITPIWKTPTNDFRMKTWWFFGYENTSEEGISADVDALKKAGFGGVVYYDQDHRGATVPEGTGMPDEGFSPEWWRHLKWAADEASRAGLSFELNISNGYVAGGRWIDPRHAAGKRRQHHVARCGHDRADVQQSRRIFLPDLCFPGYGRQILAGELYGERASA